MSHGYVEPYRHTLPNHEIDTAAPAIVILLWRCDGNPPPNLGLGITLNTVLAFLTSLTKVAFMVPIIECLGQLKWMWFLSRQHRPLMDFQVFEEATRGGLGGAKLLFKFKG